MTPHTPSIASNGRPDRPEPILKIVVFAPMASTNVRIATMVKPGNFRSVRKP